MKANDAKKIKINAEKSRANLEKLQIALNRRNIEREKKAEVENKKARSKYKNLSLLIDKDLDIIRKSLVDSIVEGNNYIVLTNDFFDNMVKHVADANDLGGQLEYKKIYFPPLLDIFKLENGFGLINLKELIKKYTKNLIRLRSKLDFEKINDNDEILRNKVYDALKFFDPEDLLFIDPIDLNIIVNIQKKMSRGFSLEADEIYFVASLIQGDLKEFYIHHKTTQQTFAKNQIESEVEYNEMRNNLDYFNHLNTIGARVVIFGENKWFNDFIELPYITENLLHLQCKNIDDKSIDLLVNIKVLNWLADLFKHDFFKDCFSFISTCAEDGFDSCLVEIQKNSLLLSCDNKVTKIKIKDSIPLFKDLYIYELWESFFRILDYKIQSTNPPEMFTINWS